jgi:hypothetical protein
MEKSRLESMHYCYLTTKHFEAQKNTKEIDFQIHKFLPFLVHPTMHLPYSHPKLPRVMHNIWHMSSY